MEGSSYNYKIDHEVVMSEAIVLDRKPECGKIGPTWVVGVIISIIFAIALSAWLALWIGVVLTFLMAMHFQNERNQEEKENIAKRMTDQNINNANNLSNQLNNLLRISNALVQELPELLKKASGALERARYEFSDSAFSPYWDCIEKATKCLATFNNNIQDIQNNAKQYYQLLQGVKQKHSFPSFFPEQEVFPDAAPIIKELNTVVRPGLTNYQFANIWEQRKTQKILIRGFNTLGDSISNMALSISSSISQLHDTLSSNTAQMIDQQVMSAESFERYSKNHISLMEDQVKRLESIDEKHK
jgi:gas vesicle protein